MHRKKAAVSLLVVFAFVFSLCACTKSIKLKSFEPQKAFTAEVSAKKDDFSFKLTLTCNSYEDIRLSFTSPETLKGFGVRTQGDELITDTFGLSDAFPADYIGEMSPLSLIISSVKQFVFAQNEYSENADGNICADCVIGGAQAQALFSPEGELLSVNMSSLNFFAEFN